MKKIMFLSLGLVLFGFCSAFSMKQNGGTGFHPFGNRGVVGRQHRGNGRGTGIFPFLDNDQQRRDEHDAGVPAANIEQNRPFQG